MADTLNICDHEITLTTDEGKSIVRPDSDLVDMFRRQLVAPLNGSALPDGVKFFDWREPRLLVVHQTAPRVHLARWIADDSPTPSGPETRYRPARISLPYCITFAQFHSFRGRLVLSESNELYFRNQPLRSLDDRLCYPALLNISKIPGGERDKPWICTQHLKRTPGSDWVTQLGELIEHTFHAGYNRSSEENEGASFYGLSEHVPRIHPISEWIKATEEEDMFGCSVEWLPAPLCVGELMDTIFAEDLSRVDLIRRIDCGKSPSANVVTRFSNYVRLRSKD